MDKLISETFEKRKEISELKASVEEDRATCLAVSATAQENISKTENSLNEKIQLVNKEIQQKEKKFQEMLEKATDDFERKNDKLVESVLNLDQNAEIKSLENQLLKFDNRFTRENEIIRKKLEKHNRRISEKTEIALEKLSFKVEEVDDKMTKEKFLLSSEIEKLAETIKDQQKSMSELKEEQYLLNLETTGKSSALGTLEKSYNELQAAFIHLGSRVQQKMNQTIINMSTNHRNYQRYNNEKIDELRDKLSEIIANHNLQGQRVRENSNLTMKLFLNEHMLNRTQSHQGYQLLQLAQEAKRCTDETDNIIRKFNEQQAQLQSQKDEMRDLRTILLQVNSFFLMILQKLF
ncbi:unnamed protein product [Oikopleura dioica]|uniref:Uncharacterized protein n=1 Tax=Oikopleura dioica TaxID=34765 RepID=E4XHH6_OIKDI|nr:unnamed protein product [Oikopleura dioica]